MSKNYSVTNSFYPLCMQHISFSHLSLYCEIAIETMKKTLFEITISLQIHLLLDELYENRFVEMKSSRKKPKIQKNGGLSTFLESTCHI